MQQKGAVFFVKKITVLLTAAVLLLSACSSATLNSAGKELEDTLASAADSSNPYVQMVKGGYRADDPGTTYNDAFSSFFGASNRTSVPPNPYLPSANKPSSGTTVLLPVR